MKNKDGLKDKIKLYKKIAILNIKHNLKKFHKWYNYYNWLLLIFNMVLLIFILSTVAGSRFPLLKPVTEKLGLPGVYELQGNVQLKKNMASENASIPLAGIQIEIGGYKCKTDSNGRYYIKFVSNDGQNIPINIKQNSNLSDGSTIIERVTFDKDEYSKEEDFLIDFK